MSQILGRVSITIDGEVIDSKPGASINLGGISRTSVVNDQSIGYAEALVAARIECVMPLKRGQSLEKFRNLADGTAVFAGDVGQRYIVNHAYLVEPPKLTGGDGVSLILEGEAAQEVLS